MVRRLLVVGTLLLPGLARAADANGVHTRDGGEFVMLQEQSPGTPWMPSLAFSFSEAQNLVVEGDGSGRTHPLLQAVDTLEAGMSIRLDDDARVGFYLPFHTAIWYDERPARRAFGDSGAWVQLALLQKKYWGLSGLAEVVVPSGPSEVYLGDAWGSFRAGTAAGLHWERWSALLNLGVKLTGEEDLPGLGWGVRMEYGAGLRRAVVGPVGVGLELLGSMPLSAANQAGAMPLEGLVSVGAITPFGLGVRVAAGAGLTHGLGSPSSRLMVVFEFRHVSPPDQDNDGVADANDACVIEPEDRDGVADRDGCPEDDADHDALPDESDACPVEPETVNGSADLDGCPDTLITVRVSVASADVSFPLETAEVWLDEQEPVMILADDPAVLLAGIGSHVVHGQAAGFDTATQPIELTVAREVLLTLEPTRYGDVQVRFVDPAGAALTATLRDGDQHLTRVPPIGLPLRWRIGHHVLKAYAPGFRVESVDIEIAREPAPDRVIVLHPSPVRVTGSRIVIGDTLFFAPDSSRLDPSAVGPLFAIARILQDDPAIQVLRIEGHADETGSSKHNLLLSRARAATVLDWLVRAGVDQDRLEAIGSGEADLSASETGTRTVDFVILAWAEDAAPG